MRYLQLSPLLFVLIFTCTFITSCGEDDQPNQPVRLCAADKGFGVMVTGTSAPITACVDDDRIVGNIEQGVQATITSENRYDILVRHTASDGTVYELRMLFSIRNDFPKALNVTGNLSSALSDPNGVWIYYQEIPSVGDVLESDTVTGGVFSLGFNDASVAAGTFADIRLAMKNQSSGASVGERRFTEGFFSISSDL